MLDEASVMLIGMNERVRQDATGAAMERMEHAGAHAHSVALQV